MHSYSLWAHELQIFDERICFLSPFLLKETRNNLEPPGITLNKKIGMTVMKIGVGASSVQAKEIVIEKIWTNRIS